VNTLDAATSQVMINGLSMAGDAFSVYLGSQAQGVSNDHLVTQVVVSFQCKADGAAVGGTAFDFAPNGGGPVFATAFMENVAPINPAGPNEDTSYNGCRLGGGVYLNYTAKADLVGAGITVDAFDG